MLPADPLAAPVHIPVNRWPSPPPSPPLPATATRPNVRDTTSTCHEKGGFRLEFGALGIREDEARNPLAGKEGTAERPVPVLDSASISFGASNSFAACSNARNSCKSHASCMHMRRSSSGSGLGVSSRWTSACGARMDGTHGTSAADDAARLIFFERLFFMIDTEFRSGT